MTDSKLDYQRNVVLNTGNPMPLLGYGTYQIPNSPEGKQMVEEAIRVGYRLLDCASFYHNEETIGDAISNTTRTELYVVSKVWNDAIYQGKEAVRASCMESIRKLKCGYLDLFLIHWPVPGKHVKAYRELERLREEGLVRDIGISNYTIEDIRELLDSGVRVMPAVNQIEINPFLHRKVTLEYMRSLGILPMSYRGLRNATGTTDPIVGDIATSLNVTPAQVLGRWLVQQQICHIPKSSKSERIKSNADIYSFCLSQEQMRTLADLTTKENLLLFKEHYLSRIVRDTPLPFSEDVNMTVE